MIWNYVCLNDEKELQRIDIEQLIQNQTKLSQAAMEALIRLLLIPVIIKSDIEFNPYINSDGGKAETLIAKVTSPTKVVNEITSKQ